MRVKSSSCLLALVLGCNVAAEIIHKVIPERDSFALCCPHPVDGEVTWSRESKGSNVDVLLVDGDRNTRLIYDPYKRYSSLADKSLHVFRADVSNTGRYYCNNQPAAEVTVIPAGTGRLTVSERKRITLKCHPDNRGSDVFTWSRDFGGKSETVLRQKKKGENQKEEFRVLIEQKALTITDLQLGDSGLYYCDGKPVVYLNVTKDERSDRDAPSAFPDQWPVLLRFVIALLFSVVIVSLATGTWRRSERRSN